MTLHPGAGKTFTLSSLAPNNIGMMPRAAAAIFNGIKADPSHHYTVHMSYMQIYMELIQVQTSCSMLLHACSGTHITNFQIWLPH